MQAKKRSSGIGKVPSVPHGPEQPATAERDDSPGRARLVQEALRLFGERGFDATSITDIADAAQVSRGLIRFHFGSKQALSDAVESYVIERLDAVIERWIQQIGNVPIADMFASRLSEFGQERDLRNYLKRCIVEPTPRNLELFKRMHQLQKRMIARFSALGARQLPIGDDWLALVSMFLQLGPIVFSAQTEAVLGRDPTAGRGAEAVPEIYSKLFERIYGLNSIGRQSGK